MGAGAAGVLPQVFHPNLDLEGNICLNILREDWKPVLTINSVVYGLNFLFLVQPPPPPPPPRARAPFRPALHQFGTAPLCETKAETLGAAVKH